MKTTNTHPIDTHTPNAAHTPGPWINWSQDTLIDVQNGDGPIPVHEIQGHYNAQTGDGDVIGYGFTEANARLIASAPALLAALELALATIERLKPDSFPFDSTKGTKDVVKQAIANARGEA